MNLPRQVAINSLVQVVGQYLNYGISIVTSIFLIRYLGPSDFGKYAFVNLYIFLFSTIAEFGLPDIIVREIAKHKEKADAILGNALILRVIFAVISVFLSITFLFLLKYPSDIFLYAVIMSSTFVFNILGITGTIFQVNLQMIYTAVTNLIVTVLFLIGTIFIVLTKQSLYEVFILSAATNIIGSLILFFFSRKFVQLKFCYDRELIRFLFKETSVNFAALVIGFFLGKASTFILSKMDTVKAIGYYNAAYKFVEGSVSMTYILLRSMLPLFAYSYIHAKEDLVKIFQKSFDLVIITFLPMAIFTTIAAKQIVVLLLGEKFLPSASALQFLIWVTLFMSSNVIFYSMVMAAGKQKKTLILYVIVLSVNIALNIIGIPKYGFMTCAVVSVITELLSMLPITLMGLKEINYQLSGKIVLKSLIASGFGGIILVLLNSKCNVIIQLILASLVYFTVLFLLKGITKEDVQLVLGKRKVESFEENKQPASETKL